MRRLLVILAVLLAPASARANTWQAPQPAADYPTGSGAVAVSGDGTIITAAPRQFGGLTEIRIGDAVAQIPTDSGGVAVAAGGAHELVAVYSSGQHLFAVSATPTGISPPADLGTGYIVALKADRAGDMALLVNIGDGTQLFYRPAGGSFGAPTPIPPVPGFGFQPALAVGPGGEALVVTPAAVSVAQGSSLYLTRRMPDGSLTAQETLATIPVGAANAISIGADAAGSVMVIWKRTANNLVEGVYRDGGGAWHPVTGLDTVPGSGDGPVLGVDDAGDAVLAFQHDGWVGNTTYALGSLDTGAFGPSTETPMYGRPSISTAADGSTLLTAAGSSGPHEGPDAVRALRRTGTGPFGPVLVVGCGGAPVAGGFSAADQAVLAFNDEAGSRWTVARDGPGAPVDRACTGLPAAGDFNEHRVRAGVPERLVLPAPPGWSIVSADWDFDGAPGYEVHTAGPAVRHVFTADEATVFVHTTLRRDDGTTADAVGQLSVVGIPQVVLSTPAQSLRSVLRAGAVEVGVRAANRDSTGAYVWVSVPSAHASMARLQLHLPEATTRFFVPLRAFGRRRLAALGERLGTFGVTVRVSLRNPGSKSATAIPIAKEQKLRITR